MGWRFNRRIKLFPGVTMNLGKNGSSFSFGPRGAKITVGKHGVRKTFGLPGTGLSYTSYSRYGEKGTSPSATGLGKPQAIPPTRNKVDVGFFSGLFMSREEKCFVESVKLLLAGKTSSALAGLSQLTALADASFIAAVLQLNEDQLDACDNSLENALAHAEDLGKHFRKYSLDIDMSFPITDIFSITLQPCIQAVQLMKVEVLQRKRDISQACTLLMSLYKADKDSLLVKISLAELILDSPNNSTWLKTLLAMTENIENDTPVHTVLLFYRSMIFKAMGLYDAAQSVLSAISRRKKDRDSGLLLAIQEERADIYELQGKVSLARKAWEKIYADCPSHPRAMQKIKSL